jgi:hypothetical protein
MCLVPRLGVSGDSCTKLSSIVRLLRAFTSRCVVKGKCPSARNFSNSQGKPCTGNQPGRTAKSARTSAIGGRKPLRDLSNGGFRWDVVNTRITGLALICRVVFVILSSFLLVSFDLPIQCPLRAVIRGHPTPGGLIALMGSHDIFRHCGQELVPIAGVDAEFEPIHLSPIG